MVMGFFHRAADVGWISMFADWHRRLLFPPLTALEMVPHPLEVTLGGATSIGGGAGAFEDVLHDIFVNSISIMPPVQAPGI